jgi:hypothetical protein
MKAALSLALIVALITPALPVTAHGQAETPRSFSLFAQATTGLLARAATREAVRLASAGEPLSSGIEAVQQGGTPVESNWSRVRQLAPGTQIIVTVKGAPSVQRCFVAGSQSDLTALNLADPALPAAATHVLREMASRHPEYFAAMQKIGTFEDENVRVGRDGVFVATRRVADLGQVVETIARSDVAEIRGPVRVRGSVHGAILGTWLGSGVGLTFGTSASSAELGWCLLTGLTVVGGFLGYRASSHKAEGTIYRAPSEL